MVGPAAPPLKQVLNGYKIKFVRFIVTARVCALADPLPFILQPVSSHLSNWCYW